MIEQSERRINVPTIESLTLEDVPAIAELYAEVFADPPWNEYTICDACQEFFGCGTNPGECCPGCDGKLLLTYPQEQTVEYIGKEALGPESTSFSLYRDSDVVGFVWGYTMKSPQELAQVKYATIDMQRKVAELLQNKGVGQLFYFSECGIKSDERNKGYSNLLAAEMIRTAHDQRSPLVMRTNWNSPMMAIADKFGMTQVLGPEVTINRIAKSIKQTGTLANNIEDTQLSDRVLFVMK